MGANAQTTVQKFLSGAVLTAEQQNFSAATGVPVFATTVTRDAAFGGANKVLAEGQTCYLESTNVVQYYDGAAWATVGPSASAVSAQGSSYVTTNQSTASASFVGLTTAQTVTLTTGTAALVFVSAIGSTTGAVNNDAIIGFSVSGATTIAAQATAAYQDTYTANAKMSLSSVTPVVLNAGSNTFTMLFRTSGGTSSWFNRTIAVLAVS